MAFEKRTWLARIGTGLNKFIIGAKDANNKQTLENSPDSVTQQGDVISADNLNDLEDRIEAGLDGIMWEKKWTNPSPSSSFIAQDVEIAGKYSEVLVFFKTDTQAKTVFAKRFRNFDMSGSSWTQAEDISSARSGGSSLSKLFVWSRAITFLMTSSTKISFGTCNATTIDFSSSPVTFSNYTENSKLIPYEIYVGQESGMYR